MRLKLETGLVMAYLILVTGLLSAWNTVTADPPIPVPVGDRQWLPDPVKTPGAILPVTQTDVCVPGYAKRVRNVPIEVKRQVYAAYGITTHRPGQYEVDHLISLELGGSNDPKNLWPQSYLTYPWNAHVKDALEDELHRQVCSGKMTLAEAQKEIRTDWVDCYVRTFHRQPNYRQPVRDHQHYRPVQ